MYFSHVSDLDPLRLTVLDGEPDCDLQTFPVLSGFGDVVTDLLGRQTDGTDLGSKERSGSNLAVESLGIAGPFQSA